MRILFLDQLFAKDQFSLHFQELPAKCALQLVEASSKVHVAENPLHKSIEIAIRLSPISVH